MTPKEYKRTMTFAERNKNAVEYSLWRWWKNYTWAKFLFLISPIVAVFVIISIFLVPTMWGKCGDTIKYRITGTTLHIEGVGSMDQFYGKDPPWWPWHNLIRKVIISDGVTEIGLYAFYEFHHLQSVEIPASVNSIQAWSFQECESLGEIYAPGVDYVMQSAFRDCSSLQYVELSTQAFYYTFLDTGAFMNCSALETIAMQPAAYYGSRCFYGCTRLDGLQDICPVGIGDFAFARCSALTGVPLSRMNEPQIGIGAFLDCTSLEKVALPSGSTVIPEAMFRGCSALTEVIVPEGITAIGEAAFSGCTALRVLTLPGSLLNIEKDAFSDTTNLSVLVVPDRVFKIDPTAFRRWTASQTVMVPSLDLLPEGLVDSEANVVTNPF